MLFRRRRRRVEIPTETGPEWATLDACSDYLPLRPNDSDEMKEMRQALGDVVFVAAVALRQRNAAIARVREMEQLEADRAARVHAMRQGRW